MTNAEVIRNMTDEQLAAFMCRLSVCETCGFCTPAGCTENRDEWLKAECEDQVLLPSEMF